jgi:hypothetical protein
MKNVIFATLHPISIYSISFHPFKANPFHPNPGQFWMSYSKGLAPKLASMEEACVNSVTAGKR